MKRGDPEKMPAMDNVPHILLVNPWIHDFAAYDFWAKPMGLLMLAGLLRQHGISISYADCLDRFHPKSSARQPVSGCGRGPYLKTPIPKPGGLNDVPRNYCRYGIKKSWFIEDLKTLRKPDLVFVTSLMTYWYPGVKETISVLKTVFPDVPVILGGIYATLCTDHAKKNIGAEAVVPGPGVHILFKLIKQFTGYATGLQFNPDDLDSYPVPAFDLQTKIPYIPLLTSLGCPFNCAYCASTFLNPGIMRRSPERVVDEITYWHEKYNIVDFAFYDDALLVQPDEHIMPLLRGIINAGLKVRFHTPNALHVRNITKEMAALMAGAGFYTIRLGLETGSFSGSARNLDNKLTQSEFLRAVRYLKDAGFTGDQVGAYLLTGLPGQSFGDVEEAVNLVKSRGITPVLAHYTPIPHTALWQQAVRSSRYAIESDPVFTNNAVSPCQKEPFSWEKISRLKKLCSA